MEWIQNNLALIWLILAIVFVLFEFILPGFVTVFLGIGAFLVSFLLWTDIINSLQMSIIVWITSSLLSALFLRNFLKKYFPGESKKDKLYEDEDAFGYIVEVIEDIYDDNDKGRIKYQGTSWPAMTETGTIEKGKKAKLIYRDNLLWVVESAPFEEDDL